MRGMLGDFFRVGDGCVIAQPIGSSKWWLKGGIQRLNMLGVNLGQAANILVELLQIVRDLFDLNVG